MMQKAFAAHHVESPDYKSSSYESLANLPRYSRWLQDQDWTGAYARHRQNLQLIGLDDQSRARNRTRLVRNCSYAGPMTDSSVDYEIKALTPDTWRDFEALVERTGGLFSGCWCVHFHHGVPDGRGEDESNRDFKRRMVEAGVAHAALVYDGADAVAWAAYGTPCELPNIHHRKQYDAETETSPDYRITCINVTKSHRKQGYGRAALRGAVQLIAEAGGGVVEGYPHDMATRDPAKKMSDSFLYNLTRKSYEEAGFTYVRPKGQQNCVMSKVVPPAG